MLFSARRKLLVAALAVTFMASSIGVAEAVSQNPQDNLYFATSGEPVGLDPALINDVDSGIVVCNIYEPLLRFKTDNTEVEPCLAEKWDVSDDGLVYTFYLRKGVKFHDGTPFNAEAVKFNFDRQAPENMLPNMSYAPLVLGDIENIEVVDEYTIRITLQQPSTPFLNNMAMSFSAAIASPTALKKYENDLMEHPVGTGPYKLESWDKGQKMVLTTNEDYWGDKPAVPNVVVSFVKDISARVEAINKGELDIINAIDANVIDDLKAGGTEILEREGNNVSYMAYNCRDGYVTADRDVRKAIAQAINVPELSKTLYKDYADPAYSFFPSFMMGYDPNVKAVSYDPEAAKAFFEEKGIKELNIMTYSNARYYNVAGGKTLAETVQSYLDKVGVKTNIGIYDWGTFKSKLVTDDWDIAFLGWIGDNGDPDNFINILASDDPVANQGLWFNPQFIRAITKATRVANGPDRAALYQQAESILAEDVGVLPLSHAKTMVAHRPNISGAFVHPIGLLFFKNAVKKAE